MFATTKQHDDITGAGGGGVDIKKHNVNADDVIGTPLHCEIPNRVT